MRLRKRTHIKVPILTEAQSMHLLTIGKALADSPKVAWGEPGADCLWKWQQNAIFALTSRDVGWFAAWRLNQYAQGYAVRTGTKMGAVLPILSYEETT
jgi:hypothetical protein